MLTQWNCLIGQNGTDKLTTYQFVTRFLANLLIKNRTPKNNIKLEIDDLDELVQLNISGIS